ncbi:hypothetical protein F7725_022652 [Dissostichus mawsoni]|uniref:UEV domain-containing protein n=1 Tax=Dissostichus mawsoni TaxID=36200 RepID=A0A7J5Z1F9_DISMA|nr:hypothetical protein F7725_022652 [Dissostichus mawsoni]
MDLRSEKIQRILSKYKFHDVAVEELQKIYRIYPEMLPSTGTYSMFFYHYIHLFVALYNTHQICWLLILCVPLLSIPAFSDNTQKDLLKLIGNVPVNYGGRSYNIPIQLWLMDSFPFTPPICLLRPTSNMVIREGKHMISKFEEDPPLSSKTTVDNKDPHELQAFVSNLQINDGERTHDQQHIKVSVIGGRFRNVIGDEHFIKGICQNCYHCKVDKLVFIDVAESSTKGGSTDLEIFSLPKVEISKDLSASAGSRVVVVTANSWSSEQSYASVVQNNVDMYRGIIPTVAQLSPNAVMLIASQPVDIMSHVAWRQSCLPPTHVIGAGCNLDSERLIAVMSKTGHSSNVQPEIAAGSSSTKPLLDRAFEMMKNRGQRSWSVGLSIADITNSILTNKMKTHSVSTLAQGWGGIGAEVFLSLPCIMGTNGSMRLAGVSLGKEEDSKLRESVTSLSNLISQLRI